MLKIFLAKFTSKISCQWMEIERYKLSALFELFTSRNGWIFRFFTPKPFLSYLPYLSLFWTNFFLKTGVYMEKRGRGVFGSIVAATAVKIRRSIFRVFKVNLSFGKLKIFQLVQNFNRIQLMSYIFIVWKKNLIKGKGWCYRDPHFKNDQKVSERYQLSAQATTLPFKNLTLGTIFSKKSPQMPTNPLQDGLVYGNVTKVSF